MSEEEEESPPPDTPAVKTVPFDPRYPNQNQTENCFRNYVDYYRCMDLLDGNPRCEYFERVFNALCPNAWIEKWEGQREAGIFPVTVVRVPKLEDYISAKQLKESQQQQQQEEDTEETNE